MNQGMYKILLAVHEPVTARYLKGLLISRGFSLAAIVSSSEEAVRESLKLCPDVAVMDLMLEGERTGLDAARTIRARAGIPVILLSESYDNVLFRQVLNADPFAFIIKHTVDENLDAAIHLAVKYSSVENRALKQERLFSSLLSLVPGAFFLCDTAPDGPVRCFTGSITGMTGLQPRELADGGLAVLRNLATPEGRIALETAMEDALEHGGSYCVSYTIDTPAGMKKNLTEKGLVVLEKDGTALLYGYLMEIGSAGK